MKIKLLLLTSIFLCGCSGPKYSHQIHNISPEKKVSVHEITKIENYYGACTINFDETYLLSEPSFSSNKICSLKIRQDVFPLGKETEAWALVQTIDGASGWVGKSWIDCSNTESEYNPSSFNRTIALAEQGLLSAQILLCEAYDSGKNVPKDQIKASKYCKLAADQGNVESQLYLGSMNELIQNFEESAKWYRKAAEGGNAEAQYRLGMLFREGKGVPKDDLKKLDWWLKSAAQGNVNAKKWLKKVFSEFAEHGIEEFNKGNFEQAFAAFEVAADPLGGNIPEAQVRLGQMYAQGNYVEKDDLAAVSWFRIASENGNVLGLRLLGDMYLNGRGVNGEDRREEGVYLIFLAAAQNDQKAKDLVEEIYQGYQLVDVDYQNKTGILTLISKVTTDQNGRKWYWKKKLLLLQEQGSKSSVNLINIPSYNVEDCETGMSGLKQGVYKGEEIVIPNHEIEMRAVSPGNHIHEFVCGKNNNQASPPPLSSISTGTGWLMYNGYVATNFHVIDGHSKISLINAESEKFEATVVLKDVANDLAILKIHAPTNNLIGLPLAGHGCSAGDQVFTIGYPHPDLMGREIKVTNGIISSSKGLNDDPRMLQISVPVQAGNSGGPLINAMGEVVGIVTSKLSAAKIFEKTGDLPQNVNYAIKANYLELLSGEIEKLPTRLNNFNGKREISEILSTYRHSVFLLVAE